MKRILFLIVTAFMAIHGFAQQYTQEDLHQFYLTLQGDYAGMLSDSTAVSLHLTPIWENAGTQDRWLYLEAVAQDKDSIVEQKILEIEPITAITFKVYVHDIRHPEVFVGKWGNPGFFGGYNTSILKGNKRFVFIKTKDQEYQTNWNRRKSLKCFPKGDHLHFKFSGEDQRLYIKRIPKKAPLAGLVFYK